MDFGWFGTFIYIAVITFWIDGVTALCIAIEKHFNNTSDWSASSNSYSQHYLCWIFKLSVSLSVLTWFKGLTYNDTYSEEFLEWTPMRILNIYCLLASVLYASKSNFCNRIATNKSEVKCHSWYCHYWLTLNCFSPPLILVILMTLV